MEINIDLIDSNPYQTRDDFDHVEALADNIKEVGLINAIIVRSMDNRYQLISGECRLRAHVLNDSTTIEAEVKDLSDEQARIISFIDNEKRKKLNPVARAKAIYGILENSEWFKCDLSVLGDTVKTLSDNRTDSVRIVEKLNKLNYDIRMKKDYDKELKKLCEKISLYPTKIIDSISLLNLPESIQNDKYNRSQVELNSIVRVEKQLDTNISKAKSIEEKSGEKTETESRKLINDKEKIMESLINKIEDNTYDKGEVKKLSDAIIKAPDELKTKVIDGNKEHNEAIANVITKIDNDKRIDKDDKEDLMEQMVNNFTPNTSENIDTFIDQYKELPHDLKEAVKDGLDINASVNIWSEKDKDKRIEIIDNVKDEKPSKQIALTKPNKPKVKPVILEQVDKLKSEFRAIEMINTDNIKTYPKACIKVIIDKWENENNISVEKIKELKEFIGDQND